MAKPKPHTYHVPKDHPVASKMKKGGVMNVRMKRMADDPGEDGTFEMQEEMATQADSPTPGAPTMPAKGKGKKAAIDYLKERRRVVT